MKTLLALLAAAAVFPGPVQAGSGGQSPAIVVAGRAGQDQACESAMRRAGGDASIVAAPPAVSGTGAAADDFVPTGARLGSGAPAATDAERMQMLIRWHREAMLAR